MLHNIFLGIRVWDFKFTFLALLNILKMLLYLRVNLLMFERENESRFRLVK